MTKFVGAEYLIACLLIENKKRGKDFVSLEELSKYGVIIQKMSQIEDIDAVFLTSKTQFFNAIYDFSDYFSCEYDGEDQLTGIAINQTKKIEDLEKRFIGYLPQEIFDLLSMAVKKCAA